MKSWAGLVEGEALSFVSLLECGCWSLDFYRWNTGFVVSAVHCKTRVLRAWLPYRISI